MTILNCSQNHTFIIFGLMYKEFIRVEYKNQISGIIGDCFDRLLCKFENRKCSIVEGQKLGIKYPNGSYSGILGRLQRNEADIYFKGENLIDEPFLESTIPIQSEKIVSGHLIIDGNATYFNLLNNFSFQFEIYLCYLMSFLFSFIFYLFLLNINRIKLRRSFIYHCPLIILHSKKNSLSLINLFLISLSLFFWFTIIIITMQIKTNKIVVDKSNFLTTEYDLLNSKMIACFVENEVESKIAANLPKKYLLSKVYHEKTKFRIDQLDEIKNYGDRCFFHKNTLPLLSFVFSNKWYTVSSDLSIMIGLLFFSRSSYKAKFWIYNHPLYEFDYYLHFTLKNKINRLFSRDAKNYLEIGLFTRMLSCFRFNSKIATFPNIKSFDNLDDYVHDNLKGFENLNQCLAIKQTQYILLLKF